MNPDEVRPPKLPLNRRGGLVAANLAKRNHRDAQVSTPLRQTVLAGA